MRAGNIVLGVIIFTILFIIWKLIRKSHTSKTQRKIYILSLLGLLFILWVELGVGLFGSFIAGN